MVTAQAQGLSLPVRPTTAPLSPALRDLFAALDRCRGTPTIRDLKRCLGDAALHLADVLPHATSDPGHYVRTRVWFTERYEALIMCWLPGQESPAHDHGASACGVRVVQGAATETLYTLGADGIADPHDRRLFFAGDVVCAADDAVHSLGNLPVPGRPVALVTLHVYAPQLRSRKYARRDVPPNPARVV